jgi:hypothetical protein
MYLKDRRNILPPQNATLVGMEPLPLPRLASGNCPACSSTEIVVKTIQPDGINYEGYCPGCGVDLAGALIDGAIALVVLR